MSIILQGNPQTHAIRTGTDWSKHPNPAFMPQPTKGHGSIATPRSNATPAPLLFAAAPMSYEFSRANSARMIHATNRHSSRRVDRRSTSVIIRLESSTARLWC
jgi:hypothetical protein